MVWEVNGTPDTLSSAGDDMDITDLTGKLLNQFLIYKITSGSSKIEVTFNNDSGSNYTFRRSANGATDTTSVNQSNIRMDISQTFDDFVQGLMVSVSSDEKLGIFHQVSTGTLGAGGIPERFEIYCKWVNTSDTLDRVDSNNNGSGSYATDSNTSCLAAD